MQRWLGTAKKVAGVAVTGLLGLAVVAGPAGAATATVGPVSVSTGSAGHPEVYAGSAGGTALQLTVAGQSLTAGVSSAQAGSDLSAGARAVGQLAPVPTADQSASVQGNGQSDAPARVCGTPALPSLPAPFPALSAGLACSSVVAAVKAGAPYAAAQGSVASVTANAAATFDQIIQPILSPVQQIFGQLNQVAPQLNPATSTVSQLLQVLGTTQTLAIQAGSSASEVTAAPGQVTALSVDSGAQIDILGIDGSPVARIALGSSRAQAIYDRATGRATPSYSPALVTVTVDPLAATGLPPQTLQVAPGQSLTILSGTPLQSTISVAGGSTVHNADGSVTATAAAVELHLLQGLGASSATAYDGGIDLALARATASVGGTPAVAAAPVSAPPPPPAAQQLPFTGSTPTLPIAGTALLGAGLLGRRLWARSRWARS